MADDPRIELPPSMLVNPPDLDFTEEPYDEPPRDRLRALLADEERAVEVMCEAYWAANYKTAWADLDESARLMVRRGQDREYRAVLAALREVAGL